MTQPTGSAPDTTLDTVRSVIAERASLAGPLLPILHGVQERLGCVPSEAVPVIAKALNLSRAEVYGVVTYYHHFRQQPAGRCALQVCRAEACQAMGAEALLAHARARTGCSAEQPTSADGAYTIEPVYCLGLCAMSPAVMVGQRAHAHMTADKLDALLDGAA